MDSEKMESATTEQIRQIVEQVYREDSRRIFATLVRLLGGDFDLAEEAMHEAFASAVEQWQDQGIPNNPRAWLVSAGRFKAIDTIRRRSRFDESLAEVARRLDQAARSNTAKQEEDVEDDRLRLIFTCCHPALATSTQVALTLREVCGLTTEEIARAFLTSPSTLAQRIVRGKAKIRTANIPYVVPSAEELPNRLESVLQVTYLVFNEGYSATAGDSLIRKDLTEEAIRLGRLLVELLPIPEAMGLLALMLLQESRRAARTNADGDLVLLEDQDRNLWNRQHIAEGLQLLERAVAAGEVGPNCVQAAIAGVHARAATADQTDWAAIVRLYDLLLQLLPSPVVALNRAVAVAMRDGPQAGLELIEAVLDEGELDQYHLAHAARADLCRRLGLRDEAKQSYERALQLARQEPERRFLQRRLNELLEPQS